MRRALLLLGLVLCCSCGPKPIPPPDTPAPALARPVDAIPADLDVVVRVDLARMRRALGPGAVAALRDRAAGAEGADRRLLEQALAAADTVWIAFRPGLAPDKTDQVVVLRGNFEKLDPRSHDAEPAWQLPIDLGGGWRLYRRPKPSTRAAPARIYLRVDDLLVFVSSAEIDSAERSIEARVRDDDLEPPEKGAVSVAARLKPLSRTLLERSPAAARLLARGQRLTASADLDADGLRAEIELSFDTEEDARDVADAAGLLVAALAENGDLPKSLAESLRIEAVGTSMVVRLSLGAEELVGLIRRVS
jgi:hypothetical protein